VSAHSDSTTLGRRVVASYRSERVLYPPRIPAGVFSTSKDSKDEKILGIREVIPNVVYILLGECME